jgi:hypothetical protein
MDGLVLFDINGYVYGGCQESVCAYDCILYAREHGNVLYPAQLPPDEHDRDARHCEYAYEYEPSSYVYEYEHVTINWLAICHTSKL